MFGLGSLPLPWYIVIDTKGSSYRQLSHYGESHEKVSHSFCRDRSAFQCCLR